MGREVVKAFLSRNRWGMVSMAITVVSWVLLFSVVQYLYAHGLWQGNVRALRLVRLGDVVSALLAFATAIAGLVKDGSKVVSAVALFVCISVFAAQE